MFRNSRFLVGGLTALFGLSLALPLPVWAQDAATTTTNSASPALISLFLLVVGLLAIGIVGARVVILPGLNPKLSAAAFADDEDDEISNPVASDKLA
jgi:hypothetical protein